MEENLPLYIYIVSIFILLLFSAFFSGSESAFFSISYLSLQRLKKSKKRKERFVYHLLSNPNRLLVTILIGNMIVNILASAIASALTIRIITRIGFNDIIGTVVAIFVMTLLLLFFGEITPKLITINNPVKFATLSIYPIYFFLIVLRPLTYIFQKFTDFITNKIIKVNINVMRDKDIESIIKISHKEGLIDKEEREMFENVFESIGKEVHEIMKPKTKMYLIDGTKGIKSIIQKIKKIHYKEIPVYKKTFNNIIGIIHRKEILPLLFGIKHIKSLREILKPIIFVPESKKIMDLLREFQNKKVDFAIVVDEYGNTVGFITLDDLIEEIIGEYKDEYGHEEIIYKKLGRNRFLIKGDTKIEDFNKFFKTNFSTEEYTTINGLLLDRFEKIPSKEETIKIGKFNFIIKKVRGPRIETIIVEVLE